MWPYGWGPAQTTPEVMHLQAGIQYLESSLRNCPNKKNINGARKGLTACHLALRNDRVWLTEEVTASLMGTGMFVFCLNTILVSRLTQRNTVILSTANKLCTVSSLLIGAGGIQKPYNRGLTDDF